MGVLVWVVRSWPHDDPWKISRSTFPSEEAARPLVLELCEWRELLGYSIKREWIS